MKTKVTNKAPLLLEGELVLEKAINVSYPEMRMSILDVTYVDAASSIHTESITILKATKDQTNFPFQLFGPPPDPTKKYIVVAKLFSGEVLKSDETLCRTTRSIPVFTDGYPERVIVPLEKV